MARLNPNPAPSPSPAPRACSAPIRASARLESTSISTSTSTCSSSSLQTNSEGRARARSEQQHQSEKELDQEQSSALHAGLEECREDRHRPRLIIARASRTPANLTVRKKTVQRSRAELGKMYPFLENVVVVEVEDESEDGDEEDMGDRRACEDKDGDGDDDARGPELEVQHALEGGEESSLFETEVDIQPQKHERGDEQSPDKPSSEDDDDDDGDDDNDDDSAYGSFNIDLPEAACPTFIMQQDSIWTYAAICAWRERVAAPSPAKALPTIAVSKRATPRAPRTPLKSPGKRLLTF